MKKRIIAVLLVGVMVFALAACGGSSAPADTGSSASGGSSATTPAPVPADNGEIDKSDWVELDLNFAAFLPETESGVREQMLFRDALDRHMPGLVHWTDYWAGTLAAQDTMYEAIITGTADYGYVDFAQTGDFPLSMLWTYPGAGIQSAAGSTAAFTDWVNSEHPAEFDDVIYLWSFVNGPSAFVTKKGVHSIEDLKGVQLYATGGMIEVVNALGGVGVNMTNGEVQEAIRSGLVDGAYSSFGALARNGVIPELMNEATVVPMGSAIGGYCFNKEKFNTMPESQQKEFMAAWEEGFYDYYIPNIEDNRILSETTILGAAKESVFTFIGPNDPEYQAFADAVAPITDAYIEKLNARGFDGQAELDTIKKYLKKWETDWWTFERYAEPYKQASEGTFDEWMSHYTKPEPFPTPGKV